MDRLHPPYWACYQVFSIAKKGGSTFVLGQELATRRALFSTCAVWRFGEVPNFRPSAFLQEERRLSGICQRRSIGGRGGRAAGGSRAAFCPQSKKRRSLLRRRPREGKGQVTINARSSRPGQTTTPESRRLGYPGLSLFEPSWRESGRSNYARKLGRRSLEMEAPWS